MSAAAEHHVPTSVKIAPPPAELERQPLVLQNRSIGWISDHIAGICEGPAPKWWLPALIVSSTALLMMVACICYLIASGVGVWGLNQPVAWAWDITNFVFWIGIGHAGTLISAILFLLRQKWRTSVNRAAEAMTLFAVACAGIFPLIHVGRIWYALWWLPPIPNNYSIWPQFRSPLLWDVFAVSTYGTVSLLFWYTGLIPDLATMRDRATTRVKKFLYGFFALGWTRLESPLEQLREGLPAPRRPLDAAGALGAFDRVVRLRRVAAPRLAHDHLSALLRRRRGLLRLRHGALAAGAAAHALQAGGHRDRPARRADVQGHPRDRLHRRLCLRDGVLHRVVWRQPL
jgi:hypothetical protein